MNEAYAASVFSILTNCRNYPLWSDRTISTKVFLLFFGAASRTSQHGYPVCNIDLMDKFFEIIIHIVIRCPYALLKIGETTLLEKSPQDTSRCALPLRNIKDDEDRHPRNARRCSTATGLEYFSHPLLRDRDDNPLASFFHLNELTTFQSIQSTRYIVFFRICELYVLDVSSLWCHWKKACNTGNLHGIRARIRQRAKDLSRQRTRFIQLYRIYMLGVHKISRISFAHLVRSDHGSEWYLAWMTCVFSVLQH